MAELKFRYSLKKASGLFAGSALLVYVCSWIVWGNLTNPAPDIITVNVARVGVWFFGAGIVLSLIYLMLSSKVIVIVGPDGLRDARLFRGAIPWDAIIDASIFKAQSKIFGVHVMLNPKFVPELRYNRLPGLRAFEDRMLTKTGLIISTFELNTKAENLLEAIQTHLKHANTNQA